MAAVTLALVLSGCADLRRSSKAQKPAQAASKVLGAWPLQALLESPDEVVELSDGSGRPQGLVFKTPLRRYAEAARRLEAVIGGRSAQFLLVGGAAPNAFAWAEHGRPVVAVNLAMLELLDEDLDSWAALIGHELAHLNLGHQMQRAERRKRADTASAAFGIALAAAGIPFGLLLADGAVFVVDRGYSRDDERAADGAAVAYMREAGFDPRGALRFHEKLASLHEDHSASLMSTHPAGAERVANMRLLIEAEPRAAR